MLTNNNKNMLCKLFESNKLTASVIENEFAAILKNENMSVDEKREQLIAVIEKIKQLPPAQIHSLTGFIKEFLHDKKNININNFDDIKRQLKTIMSPEDLDDWSDTLKEYAMYSGTVMTAVTGLILMGLIFTKQKENENIY